MSCDFCSVDARHPCRSNKEASICNNCDDQGMYLDLDEREVVKWLEYKVGSDPEGIIAVEKIKRLL